MYYKESDPPAESPATNGFKPQLVARNDLEDAIATVLRMFDKYVTEALLQEYLEVVADQPRALVYQACKDWSRHPPENRAPRAHELREKAAALRRHADEQPPLEDDRPPPSHRDVDAIFAQLLLEQPDNPFLKGRIAERARAKAQGQTLNGAAEVAAMLGGVDEATKRLPPGRVEGEDDESSADHH